MSRSRIKSVDAIVDDIIRKAKTQAMPTRTRQWMTVTEYARVWCVKPSTVYGWIRKGAVEVMRTPGGSIRIMPPDKNVAG